MTTDAPAIVGEEEVQGRGTAVLRTTRPRWAELVRLWAALVLPLLVAVLLFLTLVGTTQVLWLSLLVAALLALPVAAVIAAKVDRSAETHAVSLLGQYQLLCALALVVLAPILFTIIQAMSRLADYVRAGKPLHPVLVGWNDRTWVSGGPLSVVARTALLLLFLVWMQRVAAGLPWSRWRELITPARVVAVVGGAVALMVLSSFAFRSLHAADGLSQWWILATILTVGAFQVVGFLDGSKHSYVVAVVAGLATGLLVGAFVVVGVGAEVWTRAWTRGNLGPAMQRSTAMTLLITGFQVVTSILAAYAFAFLRFPLKRTLFAVFMGTLLLPIEVTLIANLGMMRQLGWTDTMHGLVLPFTATALGTFLIRQGFRGIPQDLIDACRLDGYGHVGFMVRFAVPLTRPVVAAFTVISALAAWNQYLWPRAVTDTNSANTLQIQLRSLISDNLAEMNLTVAGALVAALPVVILLVAFQRQIIRGLTAGAVK